MADIRRKPRIRKSAPTVRERAEAARAKANEQKPKRLRSAVAKLPRPRVRAKLPRNRATAKAGTVLRPIGKVLAWLAPRYLVNSWREVRLVTWPSRRDTWRLTGAVFIFAIIFGALVAGVDKGLDEIFKKFVLK